MRFTVTFDDLDGIQVKMTLEMVFSCTVENFAHPLTVGISTYPRTYKLLVFADDDLPRRAQATVSRFQAIFDVDLYSLVTKIIMSLQGDDEAGGGTPGENDDEEIFEDWPIEPPGRGFEVASGATGDLGRNWALLKESVVPIDSSDSQAFRAGQVDGLPTWSYQGVRLLGVSSYASYR